MNPLPSPGGRWLAARAAHAQVAAQVADQVGQDEPVGEAPGAGDALERVVIAAAEDRLEGEVGAASGRR